MRMSCRRSLIPWTTLTLALGLSLLSASQAHADSIQTFSLDNRTVTGTTKTMSGSSLTVKLDDVTVGDVTFDATLTVSGSGSLNATSSGLGVTGGASSLLNQGEGLTFSVAISDVSGGKATFTGFTALDFTFFTTNGETAVFSTDASLTTTGDNWLTHTLLSDPDISSIAPIAFSLLGKNGSNPGGGVTTSFRVDSIQGGFATAAPVPEPASVLLIAFAGALAAVRARLRRGAVRP